jgi:hypothetical protein
VILLERITIVLNELKRYDDSLKRYNDSLNRYTFHKSLQRLVSRYITIRSGFYENFSALEYF